MSETVFLGAWPGELGCELIYWNPWCRWAARELFPGQAVSVATRPERALFYEDFASDVLDVGVRGFAWARGPSACETGAVTREGAVLDLSAHGAFREHVAMIERGEHAAWRDFRECYAGIPKPSVVLLHLRKLPKRPNCNARPAEIAEIVRWTRRAGYAVAAVGHPEGSLCPEGARDLRGIPLRELCGWLAAAPCVVGPSSGPMHLAQLCGRPVVVWGNGDSVRCYGACDPLGVRPNVIRVSDGALEAEQWVTPVAEVIGEMRRVLA